LVDGLPAGQEDDDPRGLITVFLPPIDPGGFCSLLASVSMHWGERRAFFVCMEPMSIKLFQSELRRISSQQHSLAMPLPVKLLERLPFSIKAESLLENLRRLLESSPTNEWDLEFSGVKLGIDDLILTIDEDKENFAYSGELIWSNDRRKRVYEMSGFPEGCRLLKKHYSKFLDEYQRHGFVRPGYYRNHDDGLRRAANNFSQFSSMAVARALQVPIHEGRRLLELERMSRLPGSSEDLEQAIESGLMSLLRRLEVSQAEHRQILEAAFSGEGHSSEAKGPASDNLMLKNVATWLDAPRALNGPATSDQVRFVKFLLNSGGRCTPEALSVGGEFDYADAKDGCRKMAKRINIELKEHGWPFRIAPSDRGEVAIIPAEDSILKASPNSP
tara:strand:- start:382 stop:1545 length:1164 start_codon:yes stop_codon:yes gene_type:complete